MKTFVFIFARGGSKGLPRKNLLKLNGITLLEHSINIAKNLNFVDEIFVSTEDEEISKITIKNDVRLIKRPIELASDKTPEWLCWKHAINFVYNEVGEFDYFLSLPTTAPLRAVKDIENCMKLLPKNFDLILTVTKSRRNPWFNMVSCNKDKEAKLIISGDKRTINRRQDAPEAFDISTVAYAAKPSFILKNDNLWQGRIGAVEIPFERAIDIDYQIDLDIAEFLLNRQP